MSLFEDEMIILVRNLFVNTSKFTYHTFNMILEF